MPVGPQGPASDDPPPGKLSPDIVVVPPQRLHIRRHRAQVLPARARPARRPLADVDHVGDLAATRPASSVAVAGPTGLPPSAALAATSVHAVRNAWSSHVDAALCSCRSLDRETLLLNSDGCGTAECGLDPSFQGLQRAHWPGSPVVVCGTMGRSSRCSHAGQLSISARTRSICVAHQRQGTPRTTSVRPHPGDPHTGQRVRRRAARSSAAARMTR